MKVKRSFFLSVLIIASLVLGACASGGNNTSPTSPAGGAAGAATATTTTDGAAGGEATATTTGGDAGMTTETPATGTTPAAGETQASGETPAADETPAGTGGTGTGTAMTLPESCTSVELTYWNPFTGPDGPFMGQMVDAFNAENPNIVVTMNSQSDYYTQLTTAAASDTLPDVAIIHADQIATNVYRNILRPMDDMVGTMGITEADYPAGVWAAGQVAGKRYAIPLDIHPMTMFYNADLLQAAGLQEPPKTREEFEAAAKAMTADGNNGFMLTNGFPVREIFSMLIHQFGGSEFSEDGTEATWNSDAGVQALTWMKDMQTAYSQPNLEVDAELNAFKSGAVGMVWNGIWQLTNVTGDAVEFNGQANSVPQIGPQMAVWAGSHQLTLPTRQAGADECKDAASAIFIQYLTQNSVTWSQAGQIPASNAVRESAEFQALQPQADIAASVESAFFPPSVPGIGDAFAPLNETVGAVMSGQVTDIKAALDDAAERGNQILAENKQNYGEPPQ